MNEPRIIVVTGIQAAGKSTVARLLAAQFTRGVHVEADALQRMIVAGGAWPEEPGEPTGEAARQLRLRLAHMCHLGRSFFDTGFTVVLDDIILGERWTELRDELRGYPFSLVVLAPNLGRARQRDEARPKPTLGQAWAQYLDRELHRTMTGHGTWIDNSEQSPEETVDQILERLQSTGDTA